MLDMLSPAGDCYFIIDNSYLLSVANQLDCLWGNEISDVIPVLMGNFWESHLVMTGFSRSTGSYQGASIEQGFIFLERHRTAVEEARKSVRHFYENHTSCSFEEHDVIYVKDSDIYSSIIRTLPCLHKNNQILKAML